MSDLGRRIPTDFEHIEKYPLRALPELQTVPSVERTLPLPYQYRRRYDQGNEGACVGFSSSWMMSILNRWFYDADWLYRQAQQIDEWSDTPPAEGTSVRAGMDVLRTEGHRRFWHGHDLALDPSQGIAANRWATTVDELRACIAAGIPATLGINWYTAFDRPQRLHGTYWIATQAGSIAPLRDLGSIRGGHAICAYAASDRRQAIKLVNSWGMGYPPVWIPYPVVQRLLGEYGEATVVTDR